MSSLAQTLYDRTVRQFLPNKIAVFNGVAVRGQIKLLDKTQVFPDYESPICRSLRELVSEEDISVIIGGGLGVTSVIAAERVGPKGKVVVYEASSSQFDRVKNTLKINEVSGWVDLNHSIVSHYSEENLERYGKTQDATKIASEELPECDILELDCEGAEGEIIRELAFNPETIIVEAHEFLGVSTKGIISVLEERGYTIVKRETENEELGIDVITAVLDSQSGTAE